MSDLETEEFLQLKLTTGDEVIMRIIEQNENTFIGTGALTIESLEDYDTDYFADQMDDGEKAYYMLRPFWRNTDDLMATVHINPLAVVALSPVPDNILIQYLSSVKQIQDKLRGQDPEAKKEEDGNVVTFKPRLITED